jgi:transcriptional regulator with XRE-family HTH domain
MALRTDGRELAHRRELRGLSVREFAEKVGYSANHVGQIELDRRNGGPRFRRAAARVLGCAIRDITTEDRPVPAEAADQDAA